jgi:hypothetical protein
MKRSEIRWLAAGRIRTNRHGDVLTRTLERGWLTIDKLSARKINCGTTQYVRLVGCKTLRILLRGPRDYQDRPIVACIHSDESASIRPVVRLVATILGQEPIAESDCAPIETMNLMRHCDEIPLLSARVSCCSDIDRNRRAT